ncbi:amino acid transporter LysE [Phaeobacter gallaeciensis]|jgi:homoserine/homoserine lactone efflux protein|uniref:Amino acid transporter LysE n=1 Tax=Phaeobacter gallaeciensis TaxID=60890 RepID=A0A1B0ZS27_9RHOB|nr:MULTISPECIES: LysE family translocator [Phaeobacter]MDF1773231.1 LysE family translocator [Pseudophaeobacter sp. bin_em_oilr2.035]ANP36949.1 amino acid transporter LysE [Phaeobacter gallaeciensis]MDE4060934.1 LysE family translocator [Phaeobacter gallaeciensis]MDE4123953.1 LysE family translocator [Phaeobacter gallaeciensis]MDE4128423.1 LysE family translocator [Phaeobacter gallaeciensis]
MSFEAWTLFALFWVVFVTTPGPNAVNCISNGMTLGLPKAMLGVLAILTQASAFLILSALGVTALIAASPTGFFVAKVIGAGFLIFLGVRGWINATRPTPAVERPARHVYLHALAVATINPKSVAGYLAAFSQFVQPGVPIWEQMSVIMPTALVLTTLSYTGFTLLGVLMGKAALKAVFNVWIRRLLAVCFIVYGVLLGASSTPQLEGVQ